MPGDSRKKKVSASQTELHSVEKQNFLLTQTIQVYPAPQQKLGEKEGVDRPLVFSAALGLGTLAERGEIGRLASCGRIFPYFLRWTVLSRGFMVEAVERESET